jgi:hypothetical protein
MALDLDLVGLDMKWRMNEVLDSIAKDKQV